MSRKGFFSALALVTVLVLLGCAGSSIERSRIEEAKRDFQGYQAGAGSEPSSGRQEVVPGMDAYEPGQYKGCKVTSAKMLKEISISADLEYWAIELGFTGIEAYSEKPEEGVAVLLYRSLRQGEEDELMGIFSATDEDEIRMIREGTVAALDYLERLQE
jgi:hypothetical protein